jgi:hypothetical protein
VKNLTDTSTGIKEELCNKSAIIDATETGTVIDGLAMEWTSGGNVKIFAGGNYAGIARIIEGTKTCPIKAEAVAGERIALLRKGVHEAYDDETGVLAIGNPVKPNGTAGKVALWATGTDGAELLIGYVERLKDADKKILVDIVR